MNLKELRKSKKLTQKQACEYLKIPLRTYISYETDKKKQAGVKYAYMLEKLQSFGEIGENIGLLTREKIAEICRAVFSDYNVQTCYLFGSYAKGTANENSDVDLLVFSKEKGIRFFQLAEDLREKLGKKIDLLNSDQLNENPALINEVFTSGVKIYG